MDRARRRFAAVSLAAAALAAPPVARAAKEATPKVVEVDCTKASIQAALDANAGAVEVVVSGWCPEHVVIDRPGVKIRGKHGDPTQDGVTGFDAVKNANVDLGGDLALVLIEGVMRRGAKAAPEPGTMPVALFDLGVTLSPQMGIMAGESAVGLQNVRATDNTSLGFYMTSTSFGVVDGLVASDNGGGGVRANRESTINCGHCTVEDNVGWQVQASNEGKVFLYDTPGGLSYLSGPRGALAYYGGRVFLYPGTEVIATTGLALWAVQSGAVETYGALVDGPIWCGLQGQFYSTGLEQRSNGGLNNFYTECAAHFEEGDIQFVGPTQFHAEATGAIFGGSATFDDLICLAGGNFHCEETPGTVTKASSTCGGCP